VRGPVPSDAKATAVTRLAYPLTAATPEYSQMEGKKRKDRERTQAAQNSQIC
jgi:hypothetical protein